MSSADEHAVQAADQAVTRAWEGNRFCIDCGYDEAAYALNVVAQAWEIFRDNLAQPVGAKPLGKHTEFPDPPMAPFALEVSELADCAEYVIRECKDPEKRDCALLLAAARRVARINYAMAHGARS